MKELFLSKSNRRGVLLLIAIVLIIVFIPRILMFVNESEATKITSSEQAVLNKLQSEHSKSRVKFGAGNTNRFRRPPAKFNPNDYTLENWKYLGLSEKQAAIVLKFSKRGINNYQTLSKIFVIPPALLELMKDSLVFSSSNSTAFAVSNYPKKEIKEKKILELNQSSIEELVALPMIGEKLAERILKYRNRLGGFYFKEQLLEVYGVEPATFSLIEPLVKANVATLQQLHLNSATAEELKNHPYFYWNIANSVVKLRSQKGQFKSINDILESKLIDLEFFEKVKPYLAL
ncbi:MAG: helix-hairpin-helix domain-containing protein [Bacteroidota bacterium]